MSARKPTPLPKRCPLIGKRVRIRCDAEVINHYDSGPTAPERVMVEIDGMITVVPVSKVEVVA